MTCPPPGGRRVFGNRTLRPFALCLFGLAYPALGQDPPPVPQDAPPGQEPPRPGAELTTPAPSVEGDVQAGPQGWSYFLSAHGGWESNPAFESNEAAVASSTARLGAGTGYHAASRRNALSVNASGGVSEYFELEDRNSYYYSGALSWLHRFSPLTTFNLDEELTNDYARRSAILVGEGILLPLERTLTSRTSARLRQTLSTRFSLEARFQFDHIDFDSEELTDGDQLEAVLSFRRRLGERQSASISYDYMSSTTDGGPRQAYHSGHLGWTARFRPTATVDTNVGFTAFHQLDGSWRITPSVLARLTALNTRTRLEFDARYEHRVSQAFGIGEDRIADIASLTAIRPFLRKLRANLGFTYSLSQDTGVTTDPTTFRFNTQSLNAGLGYRATRRLYLDLGYSYFRSTQVSPSIHDHTVNFGVSYRKEPE